MDIPLDDVPLGLDIQKRKRFIKSPTSDAFVVNEAKQFKKVNGIRVRSCIPSRDIPLPMVNFARLPDLHKGFNQQLLQNLATLSFNLPTPIQAQCIPVMLNNSHVVACAPTGSGKTAAYLLPILQLISEQLASSDKLHVTKQYTLSSPSTLTQLHKIKLLALILAPTQELARQIWSEAVRLSHGLTEDHFLSCLGRRHYANRVKVKKKRPTEKTKPREIRLPKSTRVLVSTPCRMGQLLSLEPSQCPFDLSTLRWLVIDECDKLLEVDLTAPKSAITNNTIMRRFHSFRDQINPIFSSVCRSQQSICSEESVRVAFFSATIPDEVTEWTRTELPEMLPTASCTVSRENGKVELNLVQIRVGMRNSAVKSVSQELRYCGTEEGKLLELRFMLVRGLCYPCLIFMDSRERAKDIVKEILLSDADLLADVISSDKTEAQRAGLIRAFREGRLNVLVCTDLLGRGIDFKGVSMVVNYDMPSSKEEYIHRVGRTGRAGRRGQAVTFWTDADLPHMSSILTVIRRSGSHVDPDLERLVSNWELRRSNKIIGKRKDVSSGFSLPVIISQRRGERRLVHDLISSKKRKSEKTDSIESTEDTPGKNLKKIHWFRRWNPHRKKIRELAGARQNRSTDFSVG